MQHGILVPIDFSETTELSLKYAIGAAKVLNTGIALLHITSEDSDKPKAEDKLNEIIYKHNYAGVNMRSYTKTGNIFEGIGEAAEELGCRVIFMGTHGLKGLQVVFGSHALRVVTNSKVPFIITQDRPPKDDNIDSIVMPIEIGKDEKQVLTGVVTTAQTFKAKVHLFVARHADEFHENAIKRNLNFAKKYLAEHNVDYTTTHAETEENFDDQVIRFADAIDADMIAIINHMEGGIKNLFGANFDQNIITNSAKIPVLVMNTKDLNNITDVFGVFG